MISTALVPGIPTQRGALPGQLRSATATSRAHTLRATFAFATAGGARSLISALSGMPTWAQMKKYFTVGIAQGITEPEAVRQLADLPNSRVRLFIPTKTLNPSSLFVQPLFHPKVISLTSADAFWLFVSSANLTVSAYGDPVRNYEFGQLSSFTGTDMSPATASFERWWRHSWNCSKQATPNLLQRYASLRSALFERNPDILQFVDPPPNISSATHLWIEAGLASGIERHQVEFPEYLAEFFGPVVRARVDLTIRLGGREWFPRPLSHKTTTFGVDIWRLGTPTIRSGGEPIQNRILRFSRSDRPLTFELAVTDAGSVTARNWEQESNLFGHLGQTHGSHPRRYGLN
jgi:HKD family nuclease